MPWSAGLLGLRRGIILPTWDSRTLQEVVVDVGQVADTMVTNVF